MSASSHPQPTSPGFMSRRAKGPKTLPKLPPSAFSAPNTGTSEHFPLPPSPSTVHPESIVDANVTVSGGDFDLSQWKKEASKSLGDRIGGVVLSLPSADIKAAAQLDSGIPLISLIVPFDIENPQPTFESVGSTTSVPIAFSTVFTQSTPKAIEGLKWALERGRPIDIDVQVNMSNGALEGFDDMLSKAVDGLSNVPPIILSNLLPPPHDFELPIVKLLSHPSYHTFQGMTAALSLLPSVYIKYLPPSWNTSTPNPQSGANPDDSNSKLQREWKRRIRMYLGPVMEAFGYQRIIFGTSPSGYSKMSSKVGNWYELARESLAELGVEQECIDAVFHGNAKSVYETTLD